MKIKLILTGKSVFFERLAQIIDNTEFLALRFLHFLLKEKNYKREVKY